jgi:hypothetical protein
MIRRMGYPLEPMVVWERRPLIRRGKMASELLGRTPRDIKQTVQMLAFGSRAVAVQLPAELAV